LSEGVLLPLPRAACYNGEQETMMEFRWIDWNRDHIAEHGVDWEEAETIVRQAQPPFPRQIEEDKLLVIGRGRGGRFLQVVYVLDHDETVFVIHARALTERENETVSEKTKMTRKPANKAYWDMNTEELRQATKEFDEEYVADNAKPLTAAMQTRLQRAQAKSSLAKERLTQLTIAVRLEKALLDQCTALAKRKRISRDTLIARGLKAILAAEGET
jgi:uncharacterized DUF497 family protein